MKSNVPEFSLSEYKSDFSKKSKSRTTTSTRTSNPCIECGPSTCSTTHWCPRCQASFCNFHILSHTNYKMCVDCGVDTCLEMMGLEPGKPTNRCFKCETKSLLSKLKNVSDKLYDITSQNDSPMTKVVEQHNKDVTILYNAAHYGSSFSSKF